MAIGDKPVITYSDPSMNDKETYPNKRAIVNRTNHNRVIIFDAQGSGRKARMAIEFDAAGKEIMSTLFSPEYKTINTTIYSGKNAGNNYFYDTQSGSLTMTDAKAQTEKEYEHGRLISAKKIKQVVSK